MTNSCPTCGYKKIEFDRHFKEDGRDVYNSLSIVQNQIYGVL